jgi:hypothetical protein
MKINLTFLNGIPYWKNLVTRNAETAQAILSDPKFIEKVRGWAGFDFTSSTPGQVATTLELATEVNIKIGFYRGWFWSKAIAYEQDGAIYFNTRKEAYGAGSVGNIVHEIMHALGFSHNGNSPAGNTNAVPWRLGTWASEWKLTTSPECTAQAVQVESVT